MKTATLIKEVKGFQGEARLYRMFPPHDGNEYVVVSAVNIVFQGPETYIFASNEDGNVTNWIELDGSFKGGWSHDEALRNAGYEVKETP